MKKIISEKLPRIIRSKKKIEIELGIKITNRGKEITLEGSPLEEYTAEKVIEAIDFGFSLSKALLIKEDEYIFEIINIKDHTNRKDLDRIRGRIIGKGGKTLKTLSEITKCNFEMKDNQIGIIGDSEEIENAQTALISLIKGAKQSNVYSYLEKHHPGPLVDLGLK